MSTTYLVLDKQGTRGRAFAGRGDPNPTASTPELGKLNYPLTRNDRQLIFHEYVTSYATATGQVAGLVRVPRMAILEVIEGGLAEKPTTPAPGRA